MILVVNNKASAYADKYKLFADEEKAMQHFMLIGYSNCIAPFISRSAGMMNTFQCGDIDIGLMYMKTELKTPSESDIENIAFNHAEHWNNVYEHDKQIMVEAIQEGIKMTRELNER